MIENCGIYLHLFAIFMLIATSLSSCGYDSGEGRNGQEETRGNAISETTHSRDSTGKAGAREGDDAWCRQRLAEDTSAAPLLTRTTAWTREPEIEYAVLNYRVHSFAIQDAIDDLVGQGVTVVAAAGNDGVNEIDAPVNCRSVISLEGSDVTGRRGLASNTQPRVTLSAPEADIWARSNTGTRAPADGSYGYMHRTNVAAPQVSGVVSLMLTTNPWLTPDEFASILKRKARFTSIVSKTPPCRVISPGPGILDAEAAVSAAAAERNSQARE